MIKNKRKHSFNSILVVRVGKIFPSRECPGRKFDVRFAFLFFSFYRIKDFFEIPKYNTAADSNVNIAERVARALSNNMVRISDADSYVAYITNDYVSQNDINAKFQRIGFSFFFF